MPHKLNNNNCVLYLYLTEYSNRKIPADKVNATHTQQSMCIVFVFDGIFRPENKNNAITTIIVYCICIERNIPAGKLIQYMYIVFVLDGIPAGKWDFMCICICIGRKIPAGKWIQHKLCLYWTEYSGRKINQCIVFVLDGIFRPESKNNAITITIIVYCICIGRKVIPAGKWDWTINQYSGRKVRLNNQCVLYLYWTENSGRKVNTTQTQQQ